MSSEKKVVAVVMGGGRGTRLHPLTTERCKPAVPLAAKYRLVDIPISNCINSSINRIFILTQFHTASLHRHIQNTYHFDPFGGGFVDILSAEQTDKTSDWYQGTADAVRRNLQHLRNEEHDYVLILSGDQLYRMDFSKIIAEHASTGADVTIAAMPIPVSKIEGLGLMGVDDDLQITKFAEKPKDPAVIDGLAMGQALEAKLGNTDPAEKRCLASMGIYVFNRKALDDALANDMTDFGKEVIPSLLGVKQLNAYAFEGYWEDIGTVRAFFETNLAITDALPPFDFFDESAPIYTRNRSLPPCKINNSAVKNAVLGDGCIIEDSTITRAVISSRSFVRSGCVLEDVVMMGSDSYESAADFERNAAASIPHFGLGHDCRIKGAIIDKNTRIGDRVVLSPHGKQDGVYQHGVVIRDGVLVVPKGVTIPHGFEL
ncbi:glucose-1-phosphate adenylyltransferase [Synoicihabitans lomoniglobus]|uniref:Glucose-1-phosphate adenylyltransferase n=1 Tax=Synoicihabitans lomoniglobus TaxID=2909285 RepID=A0AAF0CRF3_9BACT|nr:glucose-1-phosphate adenylyltransferase [Opitutaceae bacterium LMO-M01]WED66667.1 glucose-1-phosphate adenylyltransferase [Opitutaceae bacterium LMO-M01]